MRLLRLVPLALSLTSLAGAVSLWSCAPAAKQDAAPAAMSAADKIEHGHYIVVTAGCNDCHTPGGLYGAPDSTRLLSGSDLGWKGPWGVSFSRNITPDQATGIGSWTEEQIVTAIRTGRRPDDSPLLPPMPWPTFSHFTDDDAAAVAAYLKSIPAIKHQSPKQVPPGQKFAGACLEFPPPPGWDAPAAPPAGATSAAPAATAPGSTK